MVSRFFCAGFRIRLSDKLRRLPVSYMDKTPAGDVIDRMMQDVSDMADSIYGIVEILLSGFLQMAVIAVILFCTDWRMAIPVVLLSPLSVLLSSKMATLGEKHWDKHFDLGGQLTSDPRRKRRIGWSGIRLHLRPRRRAGCRRHSARSFPGPDRP